MCSNQVRHNDTATLEGLVDCLQHGSIDAEPELSSSNYVQVFRLLQLAVDHLWQLREAQARLYAVYHEATVAAQRWAREAA